MNDQELKIITLLLNEMAFEGAMEHFGEAPPDIPKELFEEIVRIEIPKKYDGDTESYRYLQAPPFDEQITAYENCYPYPPPSNPWHGRDLRHRVEGRQTHRA